MKKALSRIHASVTDLVTEIKQGGGYSALGKEVLLDGAHFADAKDATAAQVITLALNSYVDPHRLTNIARQIGAQAEMLDLGLVEAGE